MEHVVEEVPFYRDRTKVPGYDVGGKTGHRADLGPEPRTAAGAAGSTTSSTTRSSGTSRREKGIPDLVVAVRIEEGRPTIARVGQLEMPVMSFELFRRIATNAITTPDLLTDRPVGPTAELGGPVNDGLATLPSLTDVDRRPRRRRHPDADALTADDLVRLTGGRLAGPIDPARSAAPPSTRASSSPGNLFVALPGERTDGHAHLAEAVDRGAAALLVTRPTGRRDRPLGDVTIIRVADAMSALGAVAAGWRTRFAPLVVGVTGSIAKTSTKEAIAAVLGDHLPDAQERGQPEQRDRPAADRAAAAGRTTRRSSWRWGCTSAARSPTSPRSPGRPSAWSPRSRPSTCRGSARSKRSSRPRVSWSRHCPRTGRRSSTPTIRSSSRMDRRTAARILRYGFAESADVRAEDVVSARSRRHALRPGRPVRSAGPCAIPALGRLSVHNALAAAAVGLAAGITLDRDRRRPGLGLGGRPHRVGGGPAAAA